MCNSSFGGKKRVEGVLYLGSHVRIPSLLAFCIFSFACILFEKLHFYYYKITRKPKLGKAKMGMQYTHPSFSWSTTNIQCPLILVFILIFFPNLHQEKLNGLSLPFLDENPNHFGINQRSKIHKKGDQNQNKQNTNNSSKCCICSLNFHLSQSFNFNTDHQPSSSI
jgi:hypothetical protein